VGKKSRPKRKRPGKSLKAHPRKSTSKNGVADEEDFIRRGSRSIEDLFTHYDAADVCVALGVSDLWLPNISSQVKHCFAFGILASMAPDRFAAANRMDTYPSFRSFIEQLYALLPAFPVLEDYVPETDWGEVKTPWMAGFFKLFYGGAVERIPDFVEAFRLSNLSRAAALDDMHVALSLQDHVISSVDRRLIGSKESILPGRIEIPSELFWAQCRVALMSASDALPSGKKPSLGLILQQGSFRRPLTWSSFGDAVMSGTALPAILIDIRGKQYPLSLRNALSVVVDNWAARTVDQDNGPDGGLTIPVADFLKQRQESNSFVAGPFSLLTRARHLPHRFAGVILGEAKFYFVMAVTEKTVSLLPKAERDLRDLIASGVEWAIGHENSAHAVALRRRDGSLPKQVALVAVLSGVATAFKSVRLPKTQARVLLLPDFVTIFDVLEDVAELERFWSYVDSNRSILAPMAGMADLFGTFRDSHELLVGGAIAPDMIALDPHWGSNWRYRHLAELWKNAPPLFPDDTPIAWRVKAPIDGIQQLIAKATPSLSWCTTVSSCVLHFVFHAADEDLDLINGQMLELIVHCLADSVFQCRKTIENLSVFERRRIVLVCSANKAAPALDDGKDEESVRAPLFGRWSLSPSSESSSISARVWVNLARAQASLTDPIDGRFEAECVTDLLSGLQSLLSEAPDSEITARLKATGLRKPRFALTWARRTVDVPDFASPELPSLAQYKIARRDLAIALRDIGALPGRYELGAAKAVIDPARDTFRQQIHARIAELDRTSLLLFCIRQHDALTVEYQREVRRVTQSVIHEVNYNRSEVLAEAHRKYINEARNYRYLLECSLSAPSAGSRTATPELIVQIVASIDWLFVLYSASDVLHNDIEVAGLELDDGLIPEVFYSSDRHAQEKAFGIEMANIKLGVDVAADDEVISTPDRGDHWEIVDAAFLKDTGFSLRHLVQTFAVLARWQSARGEQDLHLCYRASPVEITRALLEAIESLTVEEATRLIAFATLEPGQIRRLLGKASAESDVPVWDHNKRGSRYNIRSLIPLSDGTFAWGAAAADRSARIWMNSIANGYLPADFPWPHVRKAVRNIKNDLEHQLEVRAFEVCSRATPHLVHGIDFRSRFPKEGFDDVGDFDVLAYWQQLNRWLVVECKYNQPPFCLKDGRRLRERIFGIAPDRGQFSKIERRRAFLAVNADRLRDLLRWPAPAPRPAGSTYEVYVSRDIYWWMRNPPFEVPTYFVRIEALDGWLRSNGLFVQESGSADSSAP
jgi:hypothetical protein